VGERVRDWVLLFLDPNRSARLFIVGSAALTVVITALYDSVKALFGLAGAWVLAGGLLVLALLIIGALSVRKATVGKVVISEGLQPEGRVGLLVLVSPRKATAPRAIEYHLKDRKTLRFCWLIATTRSLDTAEELASTYEPHLEKIYWGKDYLVDPDRVEDTCSLVTRIFEREVPACGLTGQEVIGDITGGMKPMTAGMAVACLTQNCDMQYMMAKRGPRGEPRREVPTEPVKIDTTFLPRVSQE